MITTLIQLMDDVMEGIERTETNSNLKSKEIPNKGVDKAVDVAILQPIHMEILKTMLLKHFPV